MRSYRKIPKEKRDARTAAAVFYRPQTFDDVLKSCLIVEYAFAFFNVVDDDEKSDVDEDVFNISMNALMGDDDDDSSFSLSSAEQPKKVSQTCCSLIYLSCSKLI